MYAKGFRYSRTAYHADWAEFYAGYICSNDCLQRDPAFTVLASRIDYVLLIAVDMGLPLKPSLHCYEKFLRTVDAFREVYMASGTPRCARRWV